MKKIFNLTNIVLMFSSLMSILLMSFCLQKEKHPIFQANAYIITDATEVEIFSLENMPTLSKHHDKKEVYFEDYKVIKKLDLPTNQVTELKNIALDKANYLEKLQKKCPFQTAFAIKFYKSKRDFIILILSENTCERMLISSSERDINKKFVDLIEKNALHAFLEKVKQ